jgi:diaminopimelate epimerase
MHGLGNCFIFMDDRKEQVSQHSDLTSFSRAICNREMGIGADGLILVHNSDKADLRMQIHNEDGSEPEMCGNGIRCFARYVINEKITDNHHLEIETLAGTIHTHLGKGNSVQVDMGSPSLNTKDIAIDGEGPIVVSEHGFDFSFVSMGNPHAIAFVDNFDFDWRTIGEKVECSSAFPNKTNVEFVKITGPNEAQMNVWERGCGETMACGTGACATVVAANILGHLPREPVTVSLPGGPLEIHWNEKNRLMMTGPTVIVCRGDYFLE